MISLERRTVLEAQTLNLNPAPTPDDVWRPSWYDVPELHEKVAEEILRDVRRVATSHGAAPLSVAMQGRSGSGKTHLLGAVRDKIQHNEGYFFLVNVIDGRTFWESTAIAVVEGMSQDAIGWGTQHKTFFRRLTVDIGLARDVRDAIVGDRPLTRQDLDAFITALRTFNGQVGKECQDTARALVLNGALDFEQQDIGYAYLISEAGDPDIRTAWGLTKATRQPQEIVRDISRLIALTRSPTVIAIDQIDTLFKQSTAAFFSNVDGFDESLAKLVGPVADGLLKLRDRTQRTLVVVSCLPDTWALIAKSSASPVTDRFRETVLPDRIPKAEIGKAIVAKRFTATFDELHFSPPYPTWPIQEKAFDEAHLFNPRLLIRRVDQHLRRCLDADKVVELSRLVEAESTSVSEWAGVTKVVAAPSQLKDLDDRFAELVALADVAPALDHTTEDVHMPGLLSAALASWIDEQAPSDTTYKHDMLMGTKPVLHARLVEVIDEATENEAHWGFRAIASPHPISVISRVKAACTKVGLDRSIPLRRLVLLRNDPWPNGKRTHEVTTAFEEAGGILRTISEGDLKVFSALRVLREQPSAQLQEWLLARRPASSTELFRSLFGNGAPESRRPDDSTTPASAEPTRPAEVSEELLVVADAEAKQGAHKPAIQLGRVADTQASFEIDLESMRRHSVVFAGSGSGKTVLIRRLVEECARQGVSAIVLDPNNDLARLGDPWPEPPSGWLPGDTERARDYLDHTDVVIWTPRVSSGRPLTFQPLPDFSPVRESRDEFDQAIRSAVEALAPRAGVNGAAKLAQQGKAVLTEALQAYARGPVSGLRGFTQFLSELPEGVSQMAKAHKLGSDMAETLKAAMITDPLFGGDGTPADPGVLLTPAPGMRARVSVISFVGLTSDEQRQSFVNQLQMALFAWIKRNPAGKRPLGGLFIMDEAQTFAPSSGNTACTASSIALAAQARKYGLGLVFATQAPKGLHNQISGNATTQFFGRLNAPAQIDAARDLAQAKGDKLPDIGMIGSGEFYAAGETFSFTKVKTPMCLTYHPKAPLAPEEVVNRAAAQNNQ
jgi:hypothetical protein